ncbi:sensor histidine kinase [Magnetofaba australis]|uniref:sensor histidine kinase n=1 Tax=Magnetofaba australis TaxID=1472297 RepID=UPI001301B372|nr:sensor histidine kinase [Magnetofaba australis]
MQRNIGRLFLLALLALLNLTNELAAAPVTPPLTLTAHTTRAEFQDALDYFVDDAAAMTLAQAQQQRFSPVRGAFKSGYSSAAIWFRLRVRLAADAPVDWMLTFGPPYLNHVTLYVENPRAADGFERREYGDHALQEHLPSRLFASPLTLSPERTLTLYFRIHSSSTLYLDGAFVPLEAFGGQESGATLWIGLYLGALLTLFFINVLAGMWLRDRALIYYAVYVLSLFFLHSGSKGMSNLLLLSDWRMDLWMGVGVYGGVIGSSLMFDQLFDYARHRPLLHRAILLLTALSLIALPFSVTPYYSQHVGLFIIGGQAVALYTLGMLARRVLRRRAQPHDALYLWAFVPPAISMILNLLAVFGVMHLDNSVRDFYLVSSLFHLLLLNFALAQRIKDIDANRKKAERHAEEMERRATEQRNFLAVLSHEIKSPLGKISTSAQMIALTHPDIPEAALTRVGRIRNSAVGLSDMVERILTSEALAQGMLTLRREPVALTHVVDNALTALAEEERSRIAIHIEPPDLRFEVDPDLLTLALSNALSNGLKYSPADQPVTVRASVAHAMLTIEITDQGVGMSPQDVARLSAMYARGQSASGTSGAGLGGYILYSAVHAHDGRVQIDSQPGVGTRLRITLPPHAE